MLWSFQLQKTYKLKKHSLTSMEQKKGFLRFYLIIALLIGIIGLIDTILTLLNFNNQIYDYIILSITIFFFFFNILTLPIFHYHNVEKMAYILPIYHLSTYILFSLLGIILVLSNKNISWINISLIVISFLAALFEILFSIFLIIRLNVFHK